MKVAVTDIALSEQLRARSLELAALVWVAGFLLPPTGRAPVGGGGGGVHGRTFDSHGSKERCVRSVNPQPVHDRVCVSTRSSVSVVMKTPLCTTGTRSWVSTNGPHECPLSFMQLTSRHAMCRRFSESWSSGLA